MRDFFIPVKMKHSERASLVTYLRKFATESRWDKIVEVAEQRTRYISVVVEDIYQSHNASAVLRSCDGFGVQDVHIIENHNNFDASRQVTIGADQWLSFHRYNEPDIDNTEVCFSRLKKEGYRIVATTPHENDANLNDLDLNQKTALVFGSEIDGISDRVKELADGFLKIPMAGFSESFNISVSAAVCLYNITRRLRASSIDWKLTDEELDQLTYEWLKKSIKAGNQLEENFFKDRQANKLE